MNGAVYCVCAVPLFPFPFSFPGTDSSPFALSFPPCIHPSIHPPHSFILSFFTMDSQLEAFEKFRSTGGPAKRPPFGDRPRDNGPMPDLYSIHQGNVVRIEGKSLFFFLLLFSSFIPVFLLYALVPVAVLFPVVRQLHLLRQPWLLAMLTPLLQGELDWPNLAENNMATDTTKTAAVAVDADLTLTGLV